MIAEYTPKARAILAKLPGPRPSLEAVAGWVKRVVKFVTKEQVPLSIILELRRDSENTVNTLEQLTCELLAGLGANNPAFREAARPDAHPMLRARGLLLLQELTYACELHLEDTEDPCGQALLQIAAEDFFRFLNQADV